MYEQSVLDKENSLINSFSTMIIDENAKNLQQVSNGKLLVDFESTNTVPAVANGNGHIENVNNKKWVEGSDILSIIINVQQIVVTSICCRT